MSSATSQTTSQTSRSLVSQISFMVLTGVVITAMVVTIIYTAVALNRLQAEIDNRHRTLSNELVVIIETAWRQKNYPSMVQVLDSLLSDDDITMAQIIDKKGHIVVSTNAEQTGEKVHWNDKPSDLTLPISALGYLDLAISNKSQYAFVFGMLWQGVIATFIVTALVFFTVRRRLKGMTSDLQETVEAAETMREGLFELGLGHSKHSEIESLRTSLNETGHRLRQLTNDLQLQVERAEMASESKGIFLANMSHEIRTPLNGMIGMIDLLENEYMSSEQKDHLDTLRGSSQALLSLLNDILDFSRIEAGRLTIETEMVDIGNVVEEVVALMTPLAEDKGIRLQCTYRQKIPLHIETDPGRLRQILSNIIGNAVKFTPQGWVEVAMGMRDSEVQIDVIDTGVGIPPDQIDHVFQAFEQVDGTSRRQFGGTGLGLSISKNLSEMMGGSLSASTRNGGGTTFTLTLPHRHNTSSLTPNFFHGKKIAYFSTGDEPEINLAKSMEVLGASMTRITSPNDLQKDQFDIVFLFHEESLQNHQWFEENHYICYCGPRLSDPILTGSLFNIQTFPIFWKRLGAVDQPQLGEPKEERSVPKRTQSNVSLDGFQAEVFVVEDNKVNQRVISAILKKFRCHVTLAENGQEAVDKLNSDYAPDVILMDCQMPILDGYEATRAIRIQEKAENRESSLIIAITANAMVGDREKCIDAGMDDHLAKPITIASLENKLISYGVIQPISNE